MGQKLGIVSFTEHGSQLNERLREMLERSGYVCESYAAEKYAGKYHLFPLKVSAKAWTEKMFQSMDALLFIGACGIAVRSIAPYLQGKDKDPAVVVLDERGVFAISLLSGHLGGANELTAVLESDRCDSGHYDSNRYQRTFCGRCVCKKAESVDLRSESGKSSFCGGAR